MDTIKYRVQTHLQIHYYNHLDCIFSQSIRMLDLIRTIIFFLFTLDSSLTFYLTLAGPDLKYGSTVWNSIPSIDAKNRKGVQRKFIALSQNPCFPRGHITYEHFFKILKRHTHTHTHTHTLKDRKLHAYALFLIYIYSGSKCFRSLLSITDIRILSRNFRNSSFFPFPEKILRLLDEFPLFTWCAETSTSFGSTELP